MAENAHRPPIRSCFPPSPTGYLHVGGARSALFDWLAARSTGGQFILRIEDTDRSRLQEATVEAIFDGLRWLGLQWDEGPEVGGPFGPYVQSERLPLYHEWAHWLLEHDRAYEDFSPPRVQGQQVAATGLHEFRAFRDLPMHERQSRHDAYIQTHGNAPAIRFKMPLDGETVARDLIRGETRWQNTDLPIDPVLLKGDGFPTYHLAEAVDDHFMNRNVVMRGQEWIPSMPLHALLFRAFGWEEPIFCHLPLVTGADGKKLSKRHGDAGLHEYRAEGYLPEAIVNFCALLGWSFGDDIEIFSKEEAIARFRIEDIRPAPSVWDMDKLLWINGQWINHRLTLDDFVERSLPFLHDAGLAGNAPRDYVSRALATVKDRAKLLAEVPDLTRFYFEEPSADASMVALLAKQGGDQAAAILAAALNALADTDWSVRDHLVAAIDAVVRQFGVKRGVPFGLLRIATTGRTAAPDQADLMLVLGQGRVDARIRAALDALKAAGEG
ncbi:MAG: glutamate--tRNA ligase [Thermomicrobiales bacterium]